MSDTTIIHKVEIILANPCDNPSRVARAVQECLTNLAKHPRKMHDPAFVSATATTKVVVNAHFGAFDLPDSIGKPLREAGLGMKWDDDSWRSDPRLVAEVEALANKGDLEVVEIPTGVLWEIHNYDGQEYVAEKHRKWGSAAPTP